MMTELDRLDRAEECLYSLCMLLPASIKKYLEVGKRTDDFYKYLFELYGNITLKIKELEQRREEIVSSAETLAGM